MDVNGVGPDSPPETPGRSRAGRDVARQEERPRRVPLEPVRGRLLVGQPLPATRRVAVPVDEEVSLPLAPQAGIGGRQHVDLVSPRGLTLGQGNQPGGDDVARMARPGGRDVEDPHQGVSGAIWRTRTARWGAAWTTSSSSACGASVGPR